ncbi:MAG TPA: hypothetical protein VFL64_07430 [Rhizobacter sp.]|nr:hypothetical protein [Rhizobacter sp.]
MAMMAISVARWVVAGAALLGTHAWAADLLMMGKPLPDCPVAPFGDVPPALLAMQMSGKCGYDGERWKLETPRVKPTDTGPSLVKAEYSSVASTRLASSLLGSFKFDWAGLREADADGGLRTARTALAFGGLLQVLDGLALQTNVGMERTVVERTRATVTSVWQPFREGTLFAEWAGSEAGTEAKRIGGRLWLVPRRFAVDMALRHLPDGAGWGDQRFGVALNWPIN